MSAPIERSGRRVTARPRAASAGTAARLARAMLLPAAFGVLVPVAMLTLIIVVSGLVTQDLRHALVLAPVGVVVCLAASLFLGLWVWRQLRAPVLAGADRTTTLLTGALVTGFLLALDTIVGATGIALFHVVPGHEVYTVESLLGLLAWVVSAGTGLLWTGILLAVAAKPWGWPRAWFVALVAWALLDALVPDAGPWLVLRPWLEDATRPAQGLALTVSVVLLAVLAVRRWEPER